MEILVEDNIVNIQIAIDHALVLFELLERYSSADVLDIEDDSERLVLWDLAARLEKQLVEPFDPKYEDLLAQARVAVKRNGGCP